MSSGPGRVIVLEGINGAGKSGVSHVVADRLMARGRTVREYRDPGSTALGEELRRMLKRPEIDLCPMAQTLMFTAARVELAVERLLPHVAAGEDVILDRWWMSTYAYQSVQGVDEEFIVTLNLRVSEMRLDRNLCFFLDITPETAMERMKNLSGEGFKDRFEEKGIEFQERLRAAYHDLVPLYLTRIDGEMTEEEVQERVWSTVEMVLET
jgi:dTMP kinase